MTALLEAVRFTDGPDVDQLGGDQLGDALPELDRDPEPGKAARKRPRARSEASKTTSARQTRTGGRFTSKKAVQTGIADEIEMYAKMIALTWSMSDEECSGVLNATSRSIADSMAALAVRSEWIVERFDTTTLFADIFKLLHALMPLGRAVMAHGHLTRRTDEQDEGGERVTVATDFTGGSGYAPFRPSYAG